MMISWKMEVTPTFRDWRELRVFGEAGSYHYVKTEISAVNIMEEKFMKSATTCRRFSENKDYRRSVVNGGAFLCFPFHLITPSPAYRLNSIYEGLFVHFHFIIRASSMR